MIVKSTSDIAPTKLNIIVYGDSGVGKTSLIPTLPGKTLIISKESGLLSIRSFEIDYVEPGTISNIRDILTGDGIDAYDNIAFDSLSEIASMFVLEAEKSYPDERQALKKWGNYNESFLKFIKFTRDMDKNIYFTCLQKTTEDNIGRKFNIPDIPGALAKKLPAYFDLVFNLQVIEKDSEKIRAILTSNQDGYICKDRSGTLDVWEKPDLGNVINKVFNNG